MFQHGCHIEAKHPESGQYMEGTITKITDASMYTVGEWIFAGDLFVISFVMFEILHVVL